MISSILYGGGGISTHHIYLHSDVYIYFIFIRSNEKILFISGGSSYTGGCLPGAITSITGVTGTLNTQTLPGKTFSSCSSLVVIKIIYALNNDEIKVVTQISIILLELE